MTQETQEQEQLELLDYLQVKQSSYEGPLELMLDLIRKHKLDIHNISLIDICYPYLAYLEIMESFDMEIAIEFLDMASTLILLKSKRLLPKEEDLNLNDMDLNPEEALRRKLILYQKFQTLSELLSAKDRMGREYFTRPDFQAEHTPINIEELEWDLSIYSLLKSYQQCIKRQTFKKPHSVTHEAKTLEQKILEILAMLEPEVPESFQTLIQNDSHKEDVILSFMGILELAKLAVLEIQQLHEFSPIHLHPKADIKKMVPIFQKRGASLGILQTS